YDGSVCLSVCLSAHHVLPPAMQLDASHLGDLPPPGDRIVGIGLVDDLGDLALGYALVPPPVQLSAIDQIPGAVLEQQRDERVDAREEEGEDGERREDEEEEKGQQRPPPASAFAHRGAGGCGWLLLLRGEEEEEEEEVVVVVLRPFLFTHEIASFLFLPFVLEARAQKSLRPGTALGADR
ncbi:hypothetical protein GP486_008355, partial [Trichoglossum hirsutum]